MSAMWGSESVIVVSAKIILSAMMGSESVSVVSAKITMSAMSRKRLSL